MIGRVVILDEMDGRGVAALMVDGRLEELSIDPKDDSPLPGAIFRAVADRPMKGQGGMFVRLPAGVSGFLRQTGGIAPGQRLLVQVTGPAEPGKALPVTTRLLFKSRFAIITPDAPGLNVSRQIKDDTSRAALASLIQAAQPAKVMLATGLIVAYGYMMEAFMAWYSGNVYERFMLKNRIWHGPYAWTYWMLLLCNFIVPQLMWSKKLRNHIGIVFTVCMFVNVGMWLERFVIIVLSLHRDFLPSSWGMYAPTFWDWSTFLGTIGLFLSLLFLFLRFLLVTLLMLALVAAPILSTVPVFTKSSVVTPPEPNTPLFASRRHVPAFATTCPIVTGSKFCTSPAMRQSNAFASNCVIGFPPEHSTVRTSVSR